MRGRPYRLFRTLRAKESVARQARYLSTEISLEKASSESDAGYSPCSCTQSAEELLKRVNSTGVQHEHAFALEAQPPQQADPFALTQRGVHNKTRVPFGIAKETINELS